jgi:hypothetical protein
MRLVSISFSMMSSSSQCFASTAHIVCSFGLPAVTSFLLAADVLSALLGGSTLCIVFCVIAFRLAGGSTLRALHWRPKANLPTYLHQMLMLCGEPEGINRGSNCGWVVWITFRPLTTAPSAHPFSGPLVPRPSKSYQTCFRLGSCILDFRRCLI